jgi:tetratricopeptide (TPR) repeat protein
MDKAQNNEEPRGHLEEGELAARNKEYEKAHSFLDQAIAEDPQSVRALRAKGAVCMAQEMTADSREWFQKAYEVLPEDPKTLSGLGMCEMIDRRPHAAYGYFVKALSIDSNQLVSILQLLECSYQLGLFDDLEKVLRKYVAEHPQDNEMAFCLAGCIFKNGRLEESLELVKDLLRKDPEHQGAKELWEVIRTQNKASESGASQDQLGLSEAEKIDQVLYSLEEQKRLRNLEQVISGADELLQSTQLSEAQRETATLIKAEAFLLNGDAETSSELYAQVLQKNIYSARAKCGLGAMAASQGNWDEAEKLFRESSSIDSTYDVALAGLGLCSSNREDYEAAWNFYHEALKLNAENSRALLGVIEIGYSMNKLAEVEACLKAYLDLHPGDLNFVYSLAGCFYAQNKLQEAIKEVEKIQIFEPTHKNAQELKEAIENKMQGQAGSAESRSSSF